MNKDVKIALTGAAVIIGACILLKAIPLLVLGGIAYLLYLATRDENSIKEDSTEECKPGNQKR